MNEPWVFNALHWGISACFIVLFVAYIKAATLFSRKMENEGDVAPTAWEAWKNRK